MSALFEKMTIGTMTAKNRIVRAATAESLATSTGRPTARLVDLYRRLAEGGAGTVITGYAFVCEDGKPSEGALGIYDDAFLDDYRELADAVHDAGAKLVLQLVYGGSKSKLLADDPRRLTSASAKPGELVPNASILGPSVLENPKTHLVPTEASEAELARVVQGFADAASRACACGFDGVEVHVAHGYLLSQFLSRSFNQRTDEYGGASLEARARLAVECVAAVRRAVGEGYPVLAKINSCDSLEDPEGVHGGLSEDESARVAAWLVDAGANCIDVSGDWHAAGMRDAAGEPFFAEFGARLAREIDAPVIVTGGWRSPDAIESHLAADGIAGIAMGRPLICEPDLPARWLSGDRAPSKCTACGYCQKHVGIPCVFHR